MRGNLGFFGIFKGFKGLMYFGHRIWPINEGNGSFWPLFHPFSAIKWALAVIYGQSRLN
jgi:hypothetical protein